MPVGDVTLDEVADLVTVVAGVTDRLDPDAIADGDVKALIEQFAAIKRRADGAVVMLARRAAAVTGGQGAEGAKAAADYLARTIGTSTAAARKQIATSTQLASQAATAAAVRSGQLSGEQAAVIAEVCDIAPDAQADLIARAGAQSLHDLKRTCRDRHAQADADRESRRRRHHQRRSCTTMTETDGEWKAFLSAPADMGARFEAALRADHDAVFRDAHAAGRREPDAAYRLDALLNVMERGAATRPDTTDTERQGEGQDDGERDVASEQSGGSPMRRAGRQQTVIANVDLAALRRGRVDAGETCRIEGVGEVSLAAVRALIPAAHVAYVIRDGNDIRSVVHLGRQATAHQRTALHARGYECEVPTCRASHLLEIDHVVDWAFSRHTRLDELAWFCGSHHGEKTNGTRRLAGPPGQRRWLTATGIEISRDHPSDQHPAGAPPPASDLRIQIRPPPHQLTAL